MVKIGHYEVKSDLQYYDNHIWLERISDNELFIGITDYAQQALKDITSIMPPSAGQRFIAGSELLSIESISKEFILKSPVSCVILEVNGRPISSPDVLNSRPFESWLVRVEVLDLGGLDQLIDGEDMADNILDEVSLETRASDGDGKAFSTDEDFDYESEFSIDSGDSYSFYNDDDDSNVKDNEEDYDDW